MTSQSGALEPSSGWEKNVKFNSEKKCPIVSILYENSIKVSVWENSKLQSIKDSRELKSRSWGKMKEKVVTNLSGQNSDFMDN